jgi:NDP-sugar pyrophosphorylase family protein
MLNVLIPLSGQMPFFGEAEYPFPKPLVEINGLPMIEYVVRNLLSLGEVRPHFLVRQDYCRKFHLDDTIRLLCAHAKVTPVATETGGALCTALLAVDDIAPEEPLLVVNADQYFSDGFAPAVRSLFEDPWQGGCLVFDSVHPRWSFVRTAGEQIIEAAEKRPISRQAVAGVYGFLRGKDFVEAAGNALMKDASHDGRFYTSAAVNELILLGRQLRAVPVAASTYHSFYSPNKIAEFTGT